MVIHQILFISQFQIELFRTIQDNEGHHLTHNFRPIQPLGDRDVYFIRSLANNDKNFGQKSILEEPSQDLNKDNSENNDHLIIKNSTSAEQNDGGINGQNSLETVEQKEVDHLRQETTTIHPKKFTKLGKNEANPDRPKFWMLLLLTCSLIIDSQL